MKTLLLTTLTFLLSVTLQAADIATNVTPDEAEKLLQQNPAIVILDIRTPEEFAQGHVPHAKNFDFYGDHFAQQLAALDKDKEYLIHCAAGGRSTKACKLMDEDKFKKVYHLNGGFTAWQKAGKPIEK